MNNKEWLICEINRLRKEKNAVILAHYYQIPEIQDIADYIGDSLALAQFAQNVKEDVIILAGVYFMAETAKIVNPNKKVIIPDKNAGCSLADSCPADKFQNFIQNYPKAVVVSYVNTSAEVKALTDIVCTSTNAEKIINSIPADKEIIFGPDRNLGNYLASKTNRKLIIWDGACHVHEEFSIEKILKLKKEYPNAKIIAHPECTKPVIIISDFVGSTSGLLNYVLQDNAKEYIVATESGIIHQMRKNCPSKTFIPAPPNDSTCACNDCKFMKLITLEKIYNSLLTLSTEIILNDDIINRAKLSVLAMLKLSK